MAPVDIRIQYAPRASLLKKLPLFSAEIRASLADGVSVWGDEIGAAECINISDHRFPMQNRKIQIVYRILTSMVVTGRHMIWGLTFSKLLIDKLSPETTFNFCSNAIYMILELHLTTNAGIEARCKTDEQTLCAKRLVWIVWSIEKILCLRQGQPQVSQLWHGHDHEESNLVSFSRETL